MASRRHLVGLLALSFVSMGAAYRTPNFTVEAPTPQIAQQVGQAAEYYRKEKAQQWLGREMPNWPEPCPLQVKVTMGGAGGATSFAFDRGQVLSQHMNIEGSLERLLASVLPHEVTHTVFAHYFRTPVPRWADEGGSVLSEDEVERQRHDHLCRQILNTPGRAMPLRRLFALREYPSDVMVLYAQGFSVTNYLVERSNRAAFLNFVHQGMQEGWDNAVRAHYRHNSIEELEQTWLAHLRATKQRPPAQLARNTNPAPSENRVMLRQTVPPSQPLLAQPVPIVRGQGGDEADGWKGQPTSNGGRPDYLPSYPPQQPHTAAPAPRDPWQPPANGVRLGAPQAVQPAYPASAPPPPTYSPVGYPN
jgi:hypothetical protein